MKKLLLIISMIALSLSACAKREEPTQVEVTQTKYEAALVAEGEKQISVMAVNSTTSGLGHTTRLLCIDSVSYITYGESITPHMSPLTGKPIGCGDPEEAFKADVNIEIH